MRLPVQTYDAAARVRFADALQARVRAIPGVTDAAISSDAPLRNAATAATMQREGYPEDDIRYYRHAVTPAYFETLQIPLRAGRGIEAQDHADAPAVAVATEALAQKLWPGENAIGKRIRFGGADGELVTIVGIAADALYRDVTTNLLDPSEDPDIYFAFAQLPSAALDLTVRAAAPTTLLPDIRRAVAALDPAIPLYDVAPFPESVASFTATDRFASFLLGLFAVLSVILAAVGLYGVMAYFVGQRSREIAIRMAVGAPARTVRALVLRQGAAITLGGLLAGLVASLFASRALESMLFGVTTTDALTFGGVPLLLFTVGLLANYLPARRATRVEPQTALRSE
jgi:putative ABC transport system permease protein